MASATFLALRLLRRLVLGVFGRTPLLFHKLLFFSFNKVLVFITSPPCIVIRGQLNFTLQDLVMFIKDLLEVFLLDCWVASVLREVLFILDDFDQVVMVLAF
mmetsp:Transcript_8535/g.7885  ORF Transcript_8535/g.7885 Transcript_8535/m.7885 type:complete len:102 (+) Transcript_8535:82-387(+)